MSIFCGGLAQVSFAAGATYPKIEASFNIGSLATDPFDYTVTDVLVKIIQPDGITNSLPAFFDGGTTWRVRHTPTAPGSYMIDGVTLNGLPQSVSNLQPASWTVTGFPTNSGYVRVDPANHRRFITSNGRRFYPIGQNVAWSSPSANAVNIFPKMGAAHENWARVWMTHFYEGNGLGLNLDWPKVNGTFGQLSLPNAQHWDAIVAAAEQSGIHFQMTLQHHGQYSSVVDANWAQNPYNIANGGFLANATNFFTDATAKALTKRKLRYAIARWGYSTAIMAWELFNEVHWTDAAGDGNDAAGQWNLVQAWHNEMASFLHSQDPYHHLVTTSDSINQPIWDQTDYYQHHDYPGDLITGVHDAANISPSQTVGPVFSGEVGINTTAHVGISPPVWASIMSAQSGAAMPWFWDTIDPNNDYFLIQAASDFIKLSGLGDQDILARSSPRTTVPGGSVGSLVFAPGGGFATNAGPDVFTVGSAAPDGIGLSTAFLQGNFNRNLLTNGYTFFVNYASSGTFVVRLNQVALSGANFQMLLDGSLVTNRVFPATPGDTTPNVNITISVPAGPHTVKLANAGNDWIKLGNITLNPYAFQLGAYAIGNSNFVAAWLWHRTNVFLANATATITGTVDIAGLSPGTYAGTWWNTFTASAISNFTFDVTNASVPVTLPTPSVLRSVAFYAGLPAQAGVFPPDLAPSVVSNAPPFNLPLVITNSGGLPLSYSLSVTGANTAWLKFSSSAGDVPRSGAEIVQLAFNPAGLAWGTYNATLFVNTSDALLPVTMLPISLTILSPLEIWRQTHFGTNENSGDAADTADPDADGLINIVEYAFNSDPNASSPSPISFAVVADHLTVTFQRTHPAPADITYVPEVTDDLASGIWNSGPAYTSLVVTDNGDGTETVVVTDAAEVSSTPAHFLRIRIVSP